MPPFHKKGKEPKETVIYPSSKRAAPPFKPLRPSKVPRIASNGSESSISVPRPATSKSAAARERPPPKSVASRRRDVEDNDSSKTLSSDHEQEDEPVGLTRKPTATLQRPPESSPILSASNEDSATRADADEVPIPSQSDPTLSIPQPLLLRLLHEAFTHKNTKIDKHAIQVLQKYMEIFVREAIARAKHAKLEAAGGEGEDSELGGTWLDLEDLENVAPGLLCDF